MGIKFLGIIKIVIGLTFLVIGIIVLPSLLQQNIGNIYLVIGNISAFIVLEIYGLYGIYSGWTEFQKDSKVKKWIMWVGVVGSFCMCLVMFWVITSDVSNNMGVGGYIMLLMILLIGIRDCYTINKLRTTTAKL